MRKMGMNEFKEYLDSPYVLAEKQAGYLLFERRAYADVFPTRIRYDHDMGKMSLESLNVEEYVIWLIESKESIQENIAFWSERVRIFETAFAALSPAEQQIYQDFRRNQSPGRHVTEKVLRKLKAEMEFLLFGEIPPDRVVAAV